MSTLHPTRQDPATAEQWVDLVEAALLVGCERDDVARAVLAGALPAIRTHPALPGEWLVLVRDVRRWAAGPEAGTEA